MQTLDLFHGLDTVGGLTHAFPVAPALQQSSQPLPYDRMIVHQQDANRRAVFTFPMWQRVTSLLLHGRLFWRLPCRRPPPEQRNAIAGVHNPIKTSTAGCRAAY